MVQDHAIELAKRLDGGVHCLLGEGEVGKVAVHNLHLLAVLVLELLERLEVASHDHHIVGLWCRQKIFGNHKADAYGCKRAASNGVGGCSPREAPVTMTVLGAMLRLQMISNLLWMISHFGKLLLGWESSSMLIADDWRGLISKTSDNSTKA